MTDPEQLYAKLASGDTSRILAVLEPLGAARNLLTDVELKPVTAWAGTAATAFDSRVNSSKTAVTAAAARLTDAMSVVEAAAAAYGRMRTAADQTIRAYRAGGIPDSQAVSVLTQLRGSYEEVLRSYAGALRGIRPAFTTAAGTTAAATTASGATVPPPGTDPNRVAEWWKSLPETTRNELLATRYDALGRLRGLPAPVLNEANHHRIEADMTRFAAANTDLTNQIEARAGQLGIDPDDEGALRGDPALADLLDQRQDTNRMLDNATAANARVEEAMRSGYDTYVLAYDPVGPGRQEGTLAIAYGNPDQAGDVAVVVPGTTTTLESGFPNDSAQELRAAMDHSEPGGNATIAWLGYDAPTWDTTVAGPDNAIEGGELLKSDVDGYRAAAETPQHITVIGHSYGSTAVGYAAMDGLAADDIAFIGSPGVGASDVGQLSPGAGHVWAGASEHDPVVQGTSGSWFTADGSSVGPYDEEFGANRFGVQGEDNLLGAHSVYYSDQSLNNLANIATGNYDAVTQGTQEGSATGELVTDAGGGLWDAGKDAIRGDWDGAWDELKDTGRELLNDAGDVLIGGTGNLVEAGKSFYDNTLGRIF
ncbi:alpha/beta hydrolase [Actinophytocola glycyrrhizae]|uniref:Alpha/beta hydrolase n=1 Tax=Actinophytocola glycyrrhizae TaxID=2044873 RepID=A0ABV9SAT6_9PSEU